MKNRVYIYYTNGEVTAWKDMAEFIGHYTDCDGDFNVPAEFLIATEFNSAGEATHYAEDEIEVDNSPNDYAEHNTHWGL